MTRSTFLAIAASAFVLPLASRGVDANTPGWFTFDMPGLDAPDASPVNMQWMSPEPAGKTGFVSVKDGHFVDGAGKRLRLYGTNVTGDSCFPSLEDAPRLAKRLRQFGFNCLRLHFMDFCWNSKTRHGIWEDPEAGTVSAESLALMDRFVAECAANGIYVNINLHVAREYPGQPKIKGSRTLRMGKTIDRWYPPYIAMQEDYARRILTHVNPHTGNRYAEEPAVCCIEINNENTMIKKGLGDEYRQLPEPFIGEFRKLWTAWLQKKYGTTDRLREAWNRDVIPLGDEVLKDNGWSAENAGGAESTLKVEDGLITWHATKSGTASWNLQLQYKQLPVKPGRHTLTFEAKTDVDRQIGCNVMLDAAPWTNLGLYISPKLTTEWQTFSIAGDIAKSEDPGPLRLNISLSNKTGLLELRNVSLRPGGGVGLPEGQSLETGVDIPANDVVDDVRLDFTAFLIDTEIATTRRLVAFLKNELGCKMPIADTQVSYGAPAGALRESSCCDYIDMHGYWEHPHYQRDEKGHVISFKIKNSSQVASGGGTLANIAFNRIAGFPLGVSEYNTPAPNDHGAELFPLLGTVAALQDWDALYSYTYRDFGKDYTNTGIRSYFHLIGRANVLVHAPLGAMLFRSGLVETAKDGVKVLLPRSEITSLTYKATKSWGVWPFRVWGEERPASPALAWLRKVELELVDDGAPRAEGNTTVPEGEKRSDTGQIRWNPDAETGAWFGLDTPAAKALIGHVGGQRFDIGGVTFDVAQRPWPRDLPAYACISVVALDQKPLAESSKVLLAASARTENQNMAWTDDRTGLVLGKGAWGTGPTVSEAAPVSVTLPGAPFDVQVLDANGMPVNVKTKGTNTAAITAEDKTLWVLLTRP